MTASLIDGRRAVAAVRGSVAADHAIDHLQRGVAHPELLWDAWSGLGDDADAQRAFLGRLGELIERTARAVAAGSAGG